MQLDRDEISYLLWLDGGRPGQSRSIPERLLDLKLVDLKGMPYLTWAGREFAKIHRKTAHL